MINDNSDYIRMHLDRLSDELIDGTYGKREEELKKKKQKTSNIDIINTYDDQKKDTNKF
jgi:hypothetical protein